MRKITKASLAVAALIATTLVAGTASAEPKGGGAGANSCSLGSTTYPEGTVVGLLKCKGGKWVLIVDLPTTPLPKFFF
ncbi:MAG: hypothetical protein WDO12_11285 [Pseudomonadota bacterium]